MGDTTNRSLVEVVARRLCELDGKDPDHSPKFESGMPGRMPPRWMLYEHIARDIIGVVVASYPPDTSAPNPE